MKHHILLIFGGESSEHEVSLQSARTVAKALASTPHQVSYGYIDRQGAWWLADAASPPTARRTLQPLLGQGAFQIDNPSELLQPDLLFPVLHGRRGEDGTVQGLAELLHLPCVGPNVLAAAVTMNKDMTKRLVAEAGVPVAPWQLVLDHGPRPTYQTLVRELGDTLFVKPNSAGSSVGVNRVTNQDELDAALTEAFRHDTTVLIEQAIDGREIELAVLDGGLRAQVTEPGEIIPGDTFYSYDDKYSEHSTSRAVIPAELEDTVCQQLQKAALQAHRATAGCGMARVDFFVTADGGYVLNEINSIPGFTEISMYPKLWQADGLRLPRLLEQLITIATGNHRSSRV